ncbi:hypothetical protein GGR53DRAFT_514708 [Hypoxylon sp. FL1150]|nr:hypothetical protein GGR53DRAFT_514708 [Hypoxylon sp. FL1150]
MGEDQDLPIALRRTPRASIGGAASHTSQFHRDAASQCSRTPSKPRSKKRVRFSDPGPEIEHDADAPSTTGLTPMIRRTSLGAAPSPKRRRHSTPIRRKFHSEGDEDELSGDGNNSNNEVRFLSLRQVLDDRLKRRIRRNGLSEEMNSIDQEKRQRTMNNKSELQRLRDELEERDQEIERLQNTTMVQDTDRIIELEREIEELRNELHRRSPDVEADQTQPFDWTMAARDPFSDSYMDDDEGFGETTMADLVCSTPSKNRASASFPTPPCTSPTIPATPCSVRRGLPVTPQSSHIGVQASLPDPGKEALEAELASLRLELTKLTEVIEDHDALKARIANKLAGAGSLPDSPNGAKDQSVEAHLDSVLQALSDRTAALLDLNSSLGALGFAGRDAGEVVASLSSAFRSARLELEYLTPGELTLPLSSRGAEVLDLALTRLRDLAKRVKENDDAIDEYHALELSLRQQLGARVDATDGLQAKLRDRDARIADLEVGVERLKGAAEGYRRDVAELESLVQRLEREGKDAEARLRSEVGSARSELVEGKTAAADLEARLASAREQADACTAQLAALQKRRAAEVKALNKYHGTALAVRDARVVELRRGIEDVQRNLHEAHATIQQLRVENLGLNRRVDDEKRRAKEAVDAMKAELERVLRMSAEFLATPRKTRASTRRASAGQEEEKETSTTPEGSPIRPGAYLATELAKTGRGLKKRRYDSGLGFLDEDEDGDDAVEMV